MDPRQLLDANLPLVDRVVDRVCRRARLHGADAEDFASHVKLALLENDGAILRKWSGGSLAAFLAVVAQRLLIDLWRERGRWKPSAEAERLGPVAAMLETLLVRDGASIAESLPALLVLDPSLTIGDVERLAARLPHRTPPARTVPMAADAAQFLADARSADDRVRTAEIDVTSDRTGRIVRAALAALPLEDRTLVRLRFLSSMSIADIARVLHVEQRPLYRRLEALLAHLRGALAKEGIDGAALADVIANPETRIDFGWKTGEAVPSFPDVERAEREEVSP